jgi:histidyl-tRNA synthetase
MGVERVLELLKEQDLLPLAPPIDAFAIVPDTAALPAAMACLQKLRAQGVSIQMHAGATDAVASMKSQFKRADASGARFALIFGTNELAQSQVTVKDLRNADAVQQTQSLNHPEQWAKSLQSPA